MSLPNHDQDTRHAHDDEHETEAGTTGGPILLRRTVLKTTATGAALAASAGCVALGEDNDDEEEEEEEENGDREEVSDDEDYAAVIFPNQVTDGSTIEIEHARLPDGGFISIVDPVAAHEQLWPVADERMPTLDEILATQIKGATEFLEAGEHEEVILEPDEPLEGEKLYQVWVHQDTTGDETFTFVDSVGENDGPYPAEFGPDPDGDDPTRGGDADEVTGDSETIEPGTPIEFDGQTGGWVAIAPTEIEGETNPSLSLAAGESYEMGWTTGDGQAHNLVIQDEEGGTVDDLSTDTTSDPGDDQWLEFEATEEMAAYVCTPHAGSMIGDIVVADEDNGGEEEVDDEEGDDIEDADAEEEEAAEEGEEEEAEDDNGEREGEQDDGEMQPTQVPPITMGDAYLHRLDEDDYVGEGGTVDPTDGEPNNDHSSE